MAAVLRRFGSLPPSAKEEDEDQSVEYSIALEYTGPLLFSDIPRAVPVDIGQIPTASVVPSNSWLQNLSLPVISPIERRASGCKKIEDHLAASPSECLDKTDGSSCPTSINGEKNARLHSLDLPQSPEVSPEVVRFEDHMRSEIEELESAPCVSSSSSSYQKEEGSDYGSPRHVRKSSIVTFRDSEDVISDEESVVSDHDDIPVKPKVERNEKKGSCYRCLRRNRLTEKEACIVCDAKYCRSCVLRAMGDMPEGRKCISCIGFRIDESKRNSLGKGSKMLKQILMEAEVKRIMESEISCPSNQLPPNLLYVNDLPLDQAELVMLQSCANPPKKLRPGKYWYDKVSGYWGKEGHKPCQIITSGMNIGGQIKQNASNGNTNIIINKREITKEEVWMLKVAGIRCEDKPHFWVSEDGSYLLEGQKKVMGQLWEKRKTKLACALLSLPIPPILTGPCGDEDAKNKLELNGLHKLLLVGPDKSGTSTIFKQTKLVYGVPFTNDERQNLKLMIQSNLYSYLGILLEGREHFAEERAYRKSSSMKGKGLLVEHSGASGEMNQIEDDLAYSLSPRLKSFSDWLLKVIESGNLELVVLSATREYARFVEELWTDGAIQATYNRRTELGKLPRVATYFLERAIEVSRENYEPSNMDILYAEGITSSNGLASTEFSFPKPERADDSFQVHPFNRKDDLRRYQLIRIHPLSLGENCKWLEMFEDVNMVLFCVSLTDYDEFIVDKNGVSQNKMLESRRLLERIVTHPTFYNKDFLLVLNKFDLLEEKLQQAPLSRCEWFQDYCPTISRNHKTGTFVNGNPSLAERAFHYIAVKFKQFFKNLTEQKLYVSLVMGLEQDSVDECLRYAREIMDRESWEITPINEDSCTSIDASTTT